MYIGRKGLFPTTIEIMRRLVSFDTTSRRNGASNPNMALMEYVQNLIDDPKVHMELVSNPGDEGKNANLIIRIGPEAPGGILLSGHTDVVTVDKQPWSSDPWVLREDNGWYYGRGTADMKGFIACVLAMIPKWVDANLIKPIYVVLSYDEEIGCTGIGSALDVLKARGITPEICLIGEPTECDVVHAHKSRAAVRLIAKATGGHAAKINDPDISGAPDLIALAYSNLIRNRSSIGARLGSNLLGPASLVMTALDAGGEGNVIMSSWSPTLDFRMRDGITEAEIRAAIMDSLRDASAEYTSMGKVGNHSIDVEIKVANPGFQCIHEPTIQLAMKFAATHNRVVADYVTEAPRYVERGEQKVAIVGIGNIKVAHQPDEKLHGRQIVRGLQLTNRAGLHCIKFAA